MRGEASKGQEQTLSRDYLRCRRRPAYTERALAALARGYLGALKGTEVGLTVVSIELQPIASQSCVTRQ
jgi:hypothetical protein